MRSIDFCTPKPSLLEHPSPSSFPSAAIVCFFAARSMPCGTVRGSLSLPESFDSVPTHANVSFACRRARPETRALGTGKLGAARCRRDWGDSRFTARFSLRRPAGRSRRWRFLPPRASVPLASDAPVASFSARLESLSASRLCLEGRQDRFRVCPVKSTRIPDRERLPSDSRFCAPRVRRGGNEAA